MFTGEVWPNQIRSFGAALTQTWHWLFYFGVNRGIPSLLENTNNWGAFLFFAGWCFVALIYTFFVVPETSGMSLEDIDKVFEGPFFKAYLTSKQIQREEKDLSYLE